MADRIKEVWTTNLEEEMSYLRAAIEKYPFVAMVSPSLPASIVPAGPVLPVRSSEHPNKG